MDKPIRRINFFGGPGCGKSYHAMGLVPKLKEEGHHVDYAQEWIKIWAYEGRIPKKWDALKIFSRQLEKEYDLLGNNVDLLVSDSPILLGVAYGYKNNIPFSKQILELCTQFEEDYRSLNLFIERDDKHFQPVGRYETLEQAKVMDKCIIDTLVGSGTSFKKINTKNIKEIVTYVKWALMMLNKEKKK